jgi:endonuclease/exonuclease/phosphatase family metal-dependent hydrolase
VRGVADPDGASVLSWNLWWRFGPWEARLPAIVETIGRLEPDIAALQEVWVADGTSSAHVIAEALGYHVAVDHRLDLDGVGFGNAVLSRWPITATTTWPLPWADGFGHDEERLLLRAVVDAPRDPIQVHCTHLAWRYDHSELRQAQVREICRHIAAGRPREYPPVLCGDLNAEPHSDEVRMLTGQAAVPVPGLVFRDAWTAPGCEGPGWTWSNANPYAAAEHEPDRRIDYVLTGWRRDDGRGAPLSCRVVGDEPVDGVWPSDHLGVLATVRT